MNEKKFIPLGSAKCIVESSNSNVRVISEEHVFQAGSTVCSNWYSIKFKIHDFLICIGTKNFETVDSRASLDCLPGYELFMWISLSQGHCLLGCIGEVGETLSQPQELQTCHWHKNKQCDYSC